VHYKGLSYTARALVPLCERRLRWLSEHRTMRCPPFPPSANPTAMTATALVSTSSGPPAPPQEPTAKPKQRISKRLAQAIGLLVTGECQTQKAAAERVGMRADSLSEALHKPHVRVFYEQRARQSIAAGVMRAAARLNSLVDASSEHVSFDAARHVLGIAGIKPAADAQVSVNIDVKAGFVIDLSDPRPNALANVIEQNQEVKP
jgi:hypothetical protein